MGIKNYDRNNGIEQVMSKMMLLITLTGWLWYLYKGTYRYILANSFFLPCDSGIFIFEI